MKTTVVFILSILSTSAYAAGWRDLHGLNSHGEEVRVTKDKYAPNEDPVTIVVSVGGKNKETFGQQPCGWEDFVRADHVGELHFVCARDGNSPLAGTTFVPKKVLKKCRGVLYSCKNGCGPRVPRELVLDPWECPDLSEFVSNYVLACQPNNTRTKGIIDGSGVNVREQPELTANILSRIASGARVTILERREACLTIDDEMGQWVRVKSIDSGHAIEGWAFDAFIEYVDKYPGKLQ